MKKISLILVVLLLVSFGLSADPADSTSLHMGTSVVGQTSVVVGDYDVSVPEDLQGFKSIDPVATSDNPFQFGYDDNSFDGKRSFKIFTMTNVAGSYLVTTTAMPLSNGGANPYYLPYSVQIGTDNPVTVDSVTGESLTLMSFSASGGMNYNGSAEIKLNIEETDYQEAAQGSYTSVWTIELIKN